MKTITVRVVAKPQTEDKASSVPTFDRKTIENLSNQMNAFVDKHNDFADAMNKVVNMDENEFSPEKSVGLMTSLIRTSMKLQIFINKVDEMNNEGLVNHGCGLLDSFNHMIGDLQELFDEATGFASDIEYCGDEEDEDEDAEDEEDDDFPSEEAYCAAIVKSMSDVISHTVQEIDKFCAEDEFDIVEAEALRTKAYRYMRDLNGTIESAKEDDHEDIVKAAVENKAALKASIKKLKQLIAKHEED